MRSISRNITQETGASTARELNGCGQHSNVDLQNIQKVSDKERILG
jgi:hypothetical protein